MGGLLLADAYLDSGEAEPATAPPPRAVRRGAATASPAVARPRREQVENLPVPRPSRRHTHGLFKSNSS